MNETVNLSIAGIGFVFDNEAYEALKKYLDRIVSQYEDQPDGKEIIDDIEARIVEIILSEQPAENVVGRPLIESVITRMGSPEDIGSGGESASEDAQAPNEVFPKRLYRNPEGAKIGGVFSGLGTFFNADPVWFRLLLFLPILLVPICGVLDMGGAAGFFAILFGVLLILYFVMWIAVPLAKTPRQKLEMQGRKITASAIEQGIKRDSEYMPPKVARSSSLFYDIVSVIGTVIVILVKIFLIAVGVVLAGFILASVGLLIYTISMGGTFFLDLWEYGRWIDVSTGWLQFDASVVIITAIIPALIIALFIFGFVFKSNVNRTFIGILGAVWFIGFGYSMVSVPRDVRRLISTARVENVLEEIERSGYNVVKDDQGNVILANNSASDEAGYVTMSNLSGLSDNILLYADEDVNLKEFAGRVNGKYKGSIELAYNPNPFGGDIYVKRIRKPADGGVRPKPVEPSQAQTSPKPVVPAQAQTQTSPKPVAADSTVNMQDSIK